MEIMNLRRLPWLYALREIMNLSGYYNDDCYDSGDDDDHDEDSDDNDDDDNAGQF